MLKHLILASQSPRRRELLSLLGFSFTTVQPNVEEIIDTNLPIAEAVEDLAHRKACEVYDRHPGNIVVSADTIVLHRGEVMGKPVDAADAKAMLKKLSGDTHEVITAVCIKNATKTKTFHSRTEVEFIPFDEDFVDEYVKSKVPMDKAGAYGIQDKGALLVSRINGDYYTVMGLPIARLNQELKAFFE